MQSVWSTIGDNRGITSFLDAVYYLLVLHEAALVAVIFAERDIMGEKQTEGSRFFDFGKIAHVHEFTVTLREALRVGVIARGMEITEEDAVIGEDIADQVNRRILATGDERLINIIRVIPEEAYGQLAAIMTEATKN